MPKRTTAAPKVRQLQRSHGLRGAPVGDRDLYRLRCVHHRRWAQDPSDEQRLRLAYQAATLIAERDSPEVVQVWFQGPNPQLEGRSPARLLREGDLDEVGRAVLTAARAFAAHG